MLTIAVIILALVACITLYYELVNLLIVCIKDKDPLSITLTIIMIICAVFLTVCGIILIAL